MDDSFWPSKRVLITGHTGFKGGWLSLWLSEKGSKVIGYALDPPTEPSFFDACGLSERMISIHGDVRNLEHLTSAANQYQPELVVHMAAQALVRPSYQNPIETFATNVMGTVNVLEMVRRCPSIKTVLIITSDKCYDNREWYWGYREIDPMGGYDPYACSKGCAELVTSSFRNSFFPEASYTDHGVAIASARAGNVIGGGDWAQDRLVPDICKAAMAGDPVRIRNPKAVRPWQHVLDPLHGYICLMEKLAEAGTEFAEGWNFGPEDVNCQPVSQIVSDIKGFWGNRLVWTQDDGDHPHEAGYLKLDCSKARQRLNWIPRLDLAAALAWTVEWYQAYQNGDDVSSLSKEQIKRYEGRL
jgi:CDP-glucose 4,6-dehydratase